MRPMLPTVKGSGWNEEKVKPHVDGEQESEKSEYQKLRDKYLPQETALGFAV